MKKIKSWQPVNVVILYTSIQLNYDWVVNAMWRRRRQRQRQRRPSVLNKFSQVLYASQFFLLFGIIGAQRAREETNFERVYLNLLHLLSAVSLFLSLALQIV